jgi:hypothetical protein
MLLGARYGERQGGRTLATRVGKAKESGDNIDGIARPENRHQESDIFDLTK